MLEPQRIKHKHVTSHSKTMYFIIVVLTHMTSLLCSFPNAPNKYFRLCYFPDAHDITFVLFAEYIQQVLILCSFPDAHDLTVILFS